MIKLIFLDCDGVLNGHQKFSTGYSRLEPENVAAFNELLRAEPDAKIVLISAWRYAVLSETMTMKGMETLFLSHGVDCFERFHEPGLTNSDEDFLSWELREALINEATEESQHAGEQVTRNTLVTIVKNEQARWDYLKAHGCQIRARQIATYLNSYIIDEFAFVVIDDLDLFRQNARMQVRHIMTDPNVGFGREHIPRARRLLSTKWLDNVPEDAG